MPRRFDETINIREANTDTGAAAGAISLTNQIQQLSSTAISGFARQSRAEGAERGLESAQAVELRGESGELQTPEFKEKPLFIGGTEVKVHNKALRARYLAELNNDNREAISGFASNNPDDILKFNSEVEGYRNGLLKEVDPSIRGAVSDDVDNMITSSRVRVQDATIRKQKQENIEGLALAGENAFESAARLQRNGDGLAAGEALFEGIKAVDAMVEAGYITEAQGQERKDAGNLELAEQAFKGVMDATYETDGVDGVHAWLAENEGKPAGGFSADQWDSVTDQIQADVNRKESRKKAIAIGSLNAAKNSLRQYRLAKSLGFEVSAGDNAALNMLIAGTNLVIPKKLIDDTAKFSLMPFNDRQDVLGAAQTGKLADVDLFASMAKANQEINAMAQDDGYSLGVKQGLIEMQPLNLADPESFSQRVETASLLSSHYGVDVSPLTDDEATGISESLTSMTAQEKIQLATTLGESLTVWGQLDKNNAGQFAMAGATGDSVVMTSIFNGQELLKAGLVTRVKPLDYLPAFNDFAEGVYEPKDRKAILDAAISHYSATSGGAIDGVFDQGDFEDSITAVSGGIGKVNGFRLELPRGLSEDDFEDFIDDIQPEFVAKAGGVANYTDAEAAEKIKNGRIRSIGTNQYIIETDGGTLFGVDGTPFVLSYSLDEATTNAALKKAAAFKRLRSPRGG